MPEHHSLSIWFYNFLFKKYYLAKFGSSLKQKRFIFTIFHVWGWYKTLFTIIKELGLYFWGRLCTEACSKRLCLRMNWTQIQHQSPADTFCPSQCDESKQYQYFLLQEWCQNQTLYKYSQLPSIYKKYKNIHIAVLYWVQH